MFFKRVRNVDDAKEEVTKFLDQGPKAKLDFTLLTGPHPSPRGSRGRGKHYKVSVRMPGRLEGAYVVYEDGTVDGYTAFL